MKASKFIRIFILVATQLGLSDIVDVVYFNFRRLNKVAHARSMQKLTAHVTAQKTVDWGRKHVKRQQSRSSYYW